MTDAEKYAMIILDCQKSELTEEMQSYYYNFCDALECSHGFIFPDGSSLDIADDDHRTLNIDLWASGQIVTIHKNNREKDVFCRIHKGLTIQQMRALSDINTSGFGLIVDFYDEKDMLKESCTVDNWNLEIKLNKFYNGA